MANIYVKQSIQDNTYIFTFVVKDVSEADSILLSKYGEPDIDFGGTFDDGDGHSFTIPSNIQSLTSSFPVTVRVDVTVPPFNANTSILLTLYRTAMVTRITTAFTTLRTTTDGFTGEFLTNI